MNNDLIERIARAIYSAIGLEKTLPWDRAIEVREQYAEMNGKHSGKQLECIEAARAALSAMQGEVAEPTEAKIERIARALADDLGRQDCGEPFILSDDFKMNYLDQDEVDFLRLAQAALSVIQGEVAEPTEAKINLAERAIEEWLTAHDGEEIDCRALARLAVMQGEVGEPIPMLLYCPQCGRHHLDEPDERTPDWTNPPHRSHLCHDCGCIWRPADVPTTGVASIQTKGKADTWTSERGNAESAASPPAMQGEVGGLREALDAARDFIEQIAGCTFPESEVRGEIIGEAQDTLNAIDAALAASLPVDQGRIERLIELIARLKEIFEEAWNVVENEWSFGPFIEINEQHKAEADQIFAELLALAAPFVENGALTALTNKGANP